MRLDVLRGSRRAAVLPLVNRPIPIVSDPEVEDADGEMIERASDIFNDDGSMKLPKIEAKVPWFWKDEVEEDFEKFMTATGCNARAPYQRMAELVPAYNYA